ncbi:MAG: hypothetical protein ACTSPD_03865 [Promethearchaeota archaeon]
MRKFQKIEEKIRKYISKLSNIKFKEKLKKLALKIGISSQTEFILEESKVKKICFPCHLGILFCGNFNKNLYKKAKDCLENTFQSFFFNIFNLGYFDIPNELLSKGIKEEFKNLEKKEEKIKLHPTNKFYQILISKREENNLDMILAITNLPLYSSSNNNIIFLFGETHLKHQCSIVSSLKLKEHLVNRKNEQKLYEERLLKEIVHEIGHLVLGAEHCVKKSCIMCFSFDVKEIDQKSINLCEECRQKLDFLKKKYNF